MHQIQFQGIQEKECLYIELCPGLLVEQEADLS